MGNQVGIVPTRDALEMARERGLDLVEVAPNAVPPVCRLMDYGKFRYEQSRKEREARKNQHVIELKEVRIRPEDRRSRSGDQRAAGRKVPRRWGQGQIDRVVPGPRKCSPGNRSRRCSTSWRIMLRPHGDDRADAAPRRQNDDDATGSAAAEAGHRNERAVTTVKKQKLKTHKGAKRRFKVTATGKIMRAKGMKSHFRRRKSARVKRAVRPHAGRAQSRQKRVKRLLPYG